MNISIYLLCAFIATSFTLYGEEILEEIEMHINNGKNEKVQVENYGSYGSVICSKITDSQYIFGDYIWYMRFFSLLGHSIHEYFIAIKQNEFSKNISIFTDDKNLTIDDILDQKPIGISYSKKNNILIVIFMVHNTNDVLIIDFNVEPNEKSCQYKVKSTRTFSREDLKNHLIKYFKSNITVGQILSNRDVKEWEKFAIKTSINDNVVQYIIFSYSVHYYGKCKEPTSMSNKPVNLIFLTINKTNQMVLSIEHFSNCCAI